MALLRIPEKYVGEGTIKVHKEPRDDEFKYVSKYLKDRDDLVKYHDKGRDGVEVLNILNVKNEFGNLVSEYVESLNQFEGERQTQEVIGRAEFKEGLQKIIDLEEQD